MFLCFGSGSGSYDKAKNLDCKSRIFFADDLPSDRNCDRCVSCCVDYDGWLQFQNCLYKVVRDPLFELAITLCIVLNTFFLALEHHGMSENVRQALDIGNKVSIFFLLYFFCNSLYLLYFLGVHINFYVRMYIKINGSIKRFFSLWMEYI